MFHNFRFYFLLLMILPVVFMIFMFGNAGILSQNVLVLDADFDLDENGFGYIDDPFRGTNQGAYANGSYVPLDGFSGGGLQVTIGGIDDDNVTNMSGGWTTNFTIVSPGNTVLSFRYNLTMSQDYESSELSQVLASVDGVLHGTSPNDYVAQLNGDGNGGSSTSTGWQIFQANLGLLQAGTYSLVIGGYNNAKTTTSESTEILIDDVQVISGNVGPVAVAGSDQNVFDRDDNGIENITFDGSGSSDVDGTIASYEWREGTTVIATGVSPTPSLSIGEHTIILTVTDDSGETDTDEVVVKINSATGAPSLVNSLSFDQFKSNLQTLSSFGDRSLFTSADPQSFINAQNWIQQQLETAGYTVDRHLFTFQGLPRSNLYVTKIGKVFPDKMYIISAHLDGRGGGGATDDDGSGSILVLESALAFAGSGIETDISVRFIFWANEETGLNGSTAYVSARSSLQGIESPLGSGLYPEPTWLGIIQSDMILFDHGLPPQTNQIAGADIDIEYQVSSTFADQSLSLANSLLSGNGFYSTDYPAEIGSNMRSTDSWSFRNLTSSVSIRENQRIAEIGSGSNPQYHQPTDLFSSYSDDDFRLGFNALQMTLGTVAELAGAADIITSVSNDETVLPVSYRLEQNYPNPFNPVTNITYSLLISGKVLIKIYNVQGQVVTTLVDEFQTEGIKTISWNGRDESGLNVPSGIYFYSIKSGAFSETRKMMLIK